MLNKKTILHPAQKMAQNQIGVQYQQTYNLSQIVCAHYGSCIKSKQMLEDSLSF
jgi:hypothetical protein